MGLWCVNAFSLSKFAAWEAAVVVRERNLRAHQWERWKLASTGCLSVLTHGCSMSRPGLKELYLRHQMLNPGCSIHTQDKADDQRVYKD